MKINWTSFGVAFLVWFLLIAIIESTVYDLDPPSFLILLGVMFAGEIIAIGITGREPVES